MPVDIVVEMQRMWSGLQKDLDSLDAESSEQEIERYLDRVVVLRGVEIQTVYPDLQEVDDQADSATAAATGRSDKIQSTMERLVFPLTKSAWSAFADAVTEHLGESPRDIGVRLAALSDEDRADLGERAKTSREALS